MRRMRLLRIMMVIAVVWGVCSVQAQISSYYFNSSGFASSPWTSRGQNPTTSDQQDIGIISLLKK